MVSAEIVAAAAAHPSPENLAQLIGSVPAVDEAAVAEQVSTAVAAEHSASRIAALLDIAIGLIDLTTLEGSDTATSVAALARRAINPDPNDSGAPHTAAVCVYGDLAHAARQVLGPSSGVQLACVAGAFPAGRANIDVKLADVRYALSQGATEIDMVIDRGAFREQDFVKVFDDVARIVAECRAASRPITVKAILENGELGGATQVRQASWLAMLAGADMIKTSTGKIPSAATLPDVAIMLDAALEYEQITGRAVGVKAAGGIRTARDTVDYLTLVANIAGPAWLAPQRFRFGASSVLTDVVRARQALAEGRDPFAGTAPQHGKY